MNLSMLFCLLDSVFLSFVLENLVNSLDNGGILQICNMENTHEDRILPGLYIFTVNRKIRIYEYLLACPSFKFVKGNMQITNIAFFCISTVLGEAVQIVLFSINIAEKGNREKLVIHFF